MWRTLHDDGIDDVCNSLLERGVKDIPEHPLIQVLELDLEGYHDYEPEKIEKCDVFYHLSWNGTFGDTRNDMPLQVQNIQYNLDAVSLAKKWDVTRL